MKKAWPYEFNLVYSVTLGRDGLQTVLEVRNPSSEKWEFQMLTHTYFRVPVGQLSTLIAERIPDSDLGHLEGDSHWPCRD